MARAYVYDMVDTWNAGATTFTAIKMNVTDTASAAGSLLMNLQVGGLSQFNVAKTGLVTLNPALTTGGVLSAGTNAFKTIQFGSTVFGSNGMAAIRDGEGVVVRGVTGFVWENGANDPATGTVDLRLVRDAANTLAQRNGTNAQTFRAYKTYTDTSNYLRVALDTTGQPSLLIQSAGTGGAANFELNNQTNAAISIATNGTSRWTFTSAGNLTAVADNTYDIGASGASRPRNLYMASWIRMATTTVAALPAAATAGAGARMFVTDALAPVFGSAVAGGGAVTVPVYSTGTAWNVG